MAREMMSHRRMFMRRLTWMSSFEDIGRIEESNLFEK
jgi:hypothetical protein